MVDPADGSRWRQDVRWFRDAEPPWGFSSGRRAPLTCAPAQTCKRVVRIIRSSLCDILRTRFKSGDYHETHVTEGNQSGHGVTPSPCSGGWYTIQHESRAAIGACRDFGVPGTSSMGPSARCRLPSSWLTPKSAPTSLTDLAPPLPRGLAATRSKAPSYFLGGFVLTLGASGVDARLRSTPSSHGSPPFG